MVVQMAAVTGSGTERTRAAYWVAWWVEKSVGPSDLRLDGSKAGRSDERRVVWKAAGWAE